MLKSKTGDEVARGEEEEQSVRGEEGREQGGDEGRDTGLIEEVAVIVCRMLSNLKVNDFEKKIVKHHRFDQCRFSSFCIVEMMRAIILIVK